jgi:5-methylcytosine-specific restriction enzyme subunit McrC
MKNYQISEWKQIVVKESLLPVDYALVNQLNEQERVVVEELKNGIRIKAKSWVGILKFNNFQIQIMPKLAGGNLGLVDMLAITTGIQALRRYSSIRFLEPEEMNNIFDIIAWLYCEACEAIFTSGLRYDYEKLEGALPALKGRFLVHKQYQKRFGLLDRLECRYDEHTSNVMDNQLLAYGLLLASRISENEKIKARIRRLYSLFSASCQIDQINLDFARENIVYNRLNSHYRDAHHLAWLLIDGLGIEDIYKSKSTPSFAFLLDMNTLFEKFVYVYLKHITTQNQFSINYQRREKSIIWDMFHQRTYSTIIPDYLLTNQDTGRKTALDSKYKLYDDRKLDSADIAQIFLYAYAYNHASRPIAFLIYPTENSSEVKASMIIRRIDHYEGARIKLIGLSLKSAIDEIQKNEIKETGSMLLDQLSSG